MWSIWGPTEMVILQFRGKGSASEYCFLNTRPSGIKGMHLDLDFLGMTFSPLHHCACIVNSSLGSLFTCQLQNIV